MLITKGKMFGVGKVLPDRNKLTKQKVLKLSLMEKTPNTPSFKIDFSQTKWT